MRKIQIKITQRMQCSDRQITKPSGEVMDKQILITLQKYKLAQRATGQYLSKLEIYLPISLAISQTTISPICPYTKQQKSLFTVA